MSKSKKFHVDLAFDLNTAPVGLAAGVQYERTQNQLFPLQFAIVDRSDDQAWFPIGDPEKGNGGFAGGDSFDLHVYDITTYDGPYTGPSITGTEMVVYCSTLGGKEFDPFSSKPSADETTRESSWGWTYETGSEPKTGDSSAYGDDLPVYEVEDENGTEDFVFADPEAATYFKIGFAWKISFSDGTHKVFVYDPEWIVNTSGG